MSELTHDEIREALPAYALGAVPEEEAAVIRAHILGCEECMVEADNYAETSSRLALAVEGEPVPAGFADRVAQAAVGEGEAEPQPAGRRFSLIAALAVAAAIAVAAVMTFQVIELREEANRKEQVLAVLSRDNKVELTGVAGAEAAIAPNGVGSLFAVSGLEQAPAGKTYQLWLIDAGSPVSAGTFDVADGIALVEVAQPVEDYSGVAVTIERAGGVEEPTTEPILSS